MPTVKEQLQNLKELLDLGLITQGDFDKKKESILSAFVSAQPAKAQAPQATLPSFNSSVAKPQTDALKTAEPSRPYIDLTKPAGKTDPPLTYCPQGYYEFRCKQTSSFESVMNLGMDSGKYAMSYFCYDNGKITVRMKDGRMIQGAITDMKVRFRPYQGNTECKITSGEKSVTIYTIWHALTESQWWTLLNILTHCGEVKGLDDYICEYQMYNTTEGKTVRGVLTAVKVLSKL